MATYSRRQVLGAGAAICATPALVRADEPLSAIDVQIKQQRQEGIARLQEWIRQPSIAAENRGMSEGCALMIKLARDAGFQTAVKVPTDGHPSVFATLDAGARTTVGLYFMY